MIQAIDVTLRIGKRVLFEDVNIKFTDGNCYGLIGANGAGKSTFLKVLSGERETTRGSVSVGKGERLSVLKQDHFQYDDCRVLDTVVMGDQRLYAVMREKDALYAKPDFSEADGLRASELEAVFAEMDGWSTESHAAQMLEGLGVPADLHDRLMGQMDGALKVKVLLAQALFGQPDVLLLDEPTNHLDMDAVHWLEEFLINFERTVIVVSHDRYFLNQVCTHIADIDYGKITVFTGNYDFWYTSSQLIQRQMKDANRKKEEKIKELKDFIARFSANASKSRQATSRKKLLDKIELDDLRASSRRYPFVDFKPDREIGNDGLMIDHLTLEIPGGAACQPFSLTVERDDKIAFVGSHEQLISDLFDVLAEVKDPADGGFKWGITTSRAYFSKDHGAEFESDQSIVQWLDQYSPDHDLGFVRGFLGRMLFSGEDALKPVRVLSGGEKVRCMLSKLMMSAANVLILDDPTNHLDMESIQALNDALIRFKGIVLFTARDHQFIQTIANRIVELRPDGVVDRRMDYDAYLETAAHIRARAVAYEAEAEEEAEV